MLRLEAAAEVPRRRRIGNPRDPQQVHVGFVLPPQFQVLQAAAIAQGVVGDGENVIGFVIREVQLEQVQPLVDGRRQPQSPCQPVYQADPAVGCPDVPISDFVLNVRRSEHGNREVVGKVEFVQSPFDSPLASAAPLRHTPFHSKSFRVRGASCCSHS